MTTLVTSTMFVAKQRPVAALAADGTFQLTLRLLDRVGPDSRSVESWLVRWSGPSAAAWWRRHGEQVTAGQPLDVVLQRPRLFYSRHSEFRPAELHAAVRRLALAPRRRAAATGTDGAEGAAVFSPVSSPPLAPPAVAALAAA